MWKKWEWKNWKKWWPQWVMYCGLFACCMGFVWTSLEWTDGGRTIASSKADHYQHVVYDW